MYQFQGLKDLCIEDELGLRKGIQGFSNEYSLKIAYLAQNRILRHLKCLPDENGINSSQGLFCNNDKIIRSSDKCRPKETKRTPVTLWKTATFIKSKLKHCSIKIALICFNLAYVCLIFIHTENKLKFIDYFRITK